MESDLRLCDVHASILVVCSATFSLFRLEIQDPEDGGAGQCGMKIYIRFKDGRAEGPKLFRVERAAEFQLML